MANTPVTADKQLLVPSWSYLPVSVNLFRTRIYSMLWLVIFPAVFNNLGAYMTGIVLDKLPKHASVVDAARALEYSSTGKAGLAVVGFAAIWSIAVYPATYVMAARIARGGEDNPWEYFRQSGRYWWRLVGLTLLIGLIIIIGLILLIVPGLVFIRRYVLAPYYLIERDCGIREAMRISAKQTKPVHWYVWGTLGVLFVMVIASSLFDRIPVINMVFAPIVSSLFYFGLALRQQEISRLNTATQKSSGKSPTARPRKTSKK